MIAGDILSFPKLQNQKPEILNSPFMISALPNGGVFALDPDAVLGFTETLDAKKKRVTNVLTTGEESTIICETLDQIIPEYCRAFVVKRKLEEMK